MATCNTAADRTSHLINQFQFWCNEVNAADSGTKQEICASIRGASHRHTPECCSSSSLMPALLHKLMSIMEKAHSNVEYKVGKVKIEKADMQEERKKKDLLATEDPKPPNRPLTGNTNMHYCTVL